MKRTKYLVLVMLGGLLLNACSTAVAPTATPAPSQEQPTATERTATATSPPAETATHPLPTDTESPEMATPTQGSQAATQESSPATDTPESFDPFAFLEVGPDEWVRGPADAAVTIVEYADFQ